MKRISITAAALAVAVQIASAGMEDREMVVHVNTNGAAPVTKYTNSVAMLDGFIVSMWIDSTNGWATQLVSVAIAPPVPTQTARTLYSVDEMITDVYSNYSAAQIPVKFNDTAILSVSNAVGTTNTIRAVLRLLTQ